MRKAALAMIVALFSYTIADIMLWQRIFESHNLVLFAPLYHPGWLVMLGSQLAIGALLLIPDWRAVLFYLFALTGLAMCGVEDILYYWLDRRPIPYWLPWLDANPAILFKPVTAPNLLLSSAVWIAICIGVFLLLHWRESLSFRPLHGFPRPVHVQAHEQGAAREMPAPVDHFNPRRRRGLPAEDTDYQIAPSE